MGKRYSTTYFGNAVMIEPGKLVVNDETIDLKEFESVVVSIVITHGLAETIVDLGWVSAKKFNWVRFYKIKRVEVVEFPKWKILHVYIDFESLFDDRERLAKKPLFANWGVM